MTSGLDFQDIESRRRWAEFLRRLDYRHRGLPAAERAELRAEAEAHIRDAMAEMGPGAEVERLDAALRSYGDLPAAPPVWRKPAAMLGHYAGILVIGMMGLTALALLHIGVMDWFDPAGVGLWVYPDGDWSLSYEAQPGAEERLGAWFSPVMLAASALLAGVIYGLWRSCVAPASPLARWMRD